MTATIPKGQINAPDQLDCMSTLRKTPVRLMSVAGVVMKPEVAEVIESLQDEIERLRTDKETLFNTLHSERKEYNALQDSTKFDEALLRECYEAIKDDDPDCTLVDKLKERLGAK